MQLKISSERAASAASPAYKIKIDDINNFFEMHGYTPTSAQVNSTNLILKDLQKAYRCKGYWRVTVAAKHWLQLQQVTQLYCVSVTRRSLARHH